MVKVYYYRTGYPFVERYATLELAMTTALALDKNYHWVEFVVDADGTQYDHEAIRRWVGANFPDAEFGSDREIKQTEYETFHDEQWEVV